MSESKLKLKDEILPYSNELISTDISLRNLYHFGFNSKSLTKNLINSFKFDEVVSNIKSYLESDELSLKASGHLLVGLLRVYDKKIKLYLEELMTMFKIKKSDAKGFDGNNSAPNNLGLKSKNVLTRAPNSKLNNQDEQGKMISSTADQSSMASFLNRNGSLISPSPLNEGLFSMLNENITPNKIQMSNRTFLNSENLNSFNSTPMQMEAYRAANPNSSIGFDTKSKANMIFNSNMKSNADFIEEKSMYEEEHDVNNFFQFISDNVLRNPELPQDLNDQFQQSNIDIGEPISENAIINIFSNSDSKPLFNFESELLRKFKPKDRMVRSTNSNNLEIDEDNKMHIDVKKMTRGELNSEKQVKMVMEKFKEELFLDSQDHLKFLSSSSSNIFSIDHFFEKQLIRQEDNLGEASIQKEKLRNNGVEFENYTSFLNNFSTLDVQDFNINPDVTVNVHEKLSKIYEEEEKLRVDNNFENDFDNFDKGVEPNNEMFNDSYNLADNNFEFSNQNKGNFSNFQQRVQDIFKKKKKEVTFPHILENEIIKNDFLPHEAFYNLLCMAQRSEITLTQKETFNNQKILVSIFK